MDLNHVIISGRLTRDPVLRYIPGSGKAVIDLNIAVNRFFHDSSSHDEKKETTFVSVVVWDKRAEVCAKYLKKGSTVLVDGRLKQEYFERDGQKLTKTRVVANDVQFMEKKAEQETVSAAAMESDDTPF